MPHHNSQSSPLLLHPPALASSPSNVFQMPSTPSRSSSPAYGSVAGPSTTAAGAHQIPFNATPVHHAPSPLGFGFGFGSSFGGNNQSIQSASHSSLAATSALAHSFASPSSSISHSPRRADAKRRRDIEDDQADEDMDQGASQLPSVSPRLRSSLGTSETTLAADPTKRALASKRVRAGLVSSSSSLGPLPFLSGPAGQSRPSWESPAEASHPAQTHHAPGKGRMSGLDVDLGKMLASMDKASLLSVLMNLLSQNRDPNLAAQILTLLPTPSLESVEVALDEAEKNVRAAIPFVVQGGGAGVRDEYTWSRVRAPLAAFADTALSYLPFFVTELGTKQTGDAARLDTGAAGVARREEVHPATTFTFLHALTLRVLRLHALLPSVPKSSLSFNAFGPDRPATSFSFGFGSGAGGNRNSTSSSAAPPSHKSSDVQTGKHANLAGRIPASYASPVSPDALLSSLMPALLKQWTVLVERLDRAVNVEGRMFGQEVVLGWARALDTINSQGHPSGPASGSNPFINSPRSAAKPEETIIREAMDEVRNRLERDLGWLVGGNQGPAGSRPCSSAARPSNQHVGPQDVKAPQDVLSNGASYAPTSAQSVKRTRGSSMDDEEEEL